jgi:dTDP-4-amino-4,6-dideoxygalactose transaminase
MKIPVFEIKRQNAEIAGELMTAVKDVIESGAYILGKKVAEFESKFAKYLGVKYAVGVASGTDAITLALLSCGIKQRDEVIMPANSYPSVFGATAAGAMPKLVDIDPKTLNINPEKIEQAITKKTKAILAVHLYGKPADMEKIMAIGKKYKIPIVEDCAQACGAEVRINQSTNKPINQLSNKPITKWAKVGSIGDIGCFSFYPTKNLGCFGDGGMIVTNNPYIYERLKLLRMYGEKDRYNSVIVGRNSRLDELQAAILLVKLKYLDGWNEKRRKIAEKYVNYLDLRVLSRLTPDKYSISPAERDRSASLSVVPPIVPPVIKIKDHKHAFHLFVIRANNREKLKEYLKKEGIGTGIHYPTPVHLQKSFAFLGFKEGDFPESEKACREVLSLPIWPEMEKKEVKSIADAVLKFRLK